MHNIETEKLITKVKELINESKYSEITPLLEHIHPADIVDMIENLDIEEQVHVIQALSSEQAADVIQELDPEEQSRIVELMGTAKSSEILKEMDSDDAADIIGEMSEDEAEKILDLMSDEGEDVRELLQYDEDTSGGIMATEYISIKSDMDVGHTLSFLRKEAPDAETVYYIYVVDDNDHLVGVVSLRDLVVNDFHEKIEYIMNPDVVYIKADSDQEEAANLFKKYGFLTLPVVDEENKLTGIITADDILDVVEEEATEDMHKFAGTVPLEQPYFSTKISSLWKKRILWLLMLFIAESFTGKIMSVYQDALQTFIILSFFVPMLIDCGGNAGAQATATVVRGLAVGDINAKDIFKVIWREIRVGLMLGLTMAIVAFVRAWISGGTPAVGIVVSLSVLAIVCLGTLMGSFLPMVVSKLGFDPAVVAAPIITTVVDSVGLLIYFNIAHMFLNI